MKIMRFKGFCRLTGFGAEKPPVKRVKRKNRERKVGAHSEDQMRKALQEIKQGKSIHQAAADHAIPFTTVRRYYVKLKETPEHHRLTPNYAVNQVFTKDQELVLKDYYKECASEWYGLSTKECRQVAYEIAKMNDIKMPKSWTANQLAGVDWLKSFRSRHPDVKLRKPETTLAQAPASNKETVSRFYDHLENVMSQHPAFAAAKKTSNLNETSTPGHNLIKEKQEPSIECWFTDSP